MTGKFLHMGAPVASWLSHSFSMCRLHSASLLLALALCCLQMSLAFHRYTSRWLAPAPPCLGGALLHMACAPTALSS